MTHLPRPPAPRRILIVANRLPVSVRRSAGSLEFIPSTGGLATGLRSLLKTHEAIWVGWPGNVAKQDVELVRTRLSEEHHCHPVFLSERLVERYYEGYANKTIWPIFHSFPSAARHIPGEWEAYVKANQLFADTVERIYRPGDIVWIHDYHLMLLPKMLRAKFPGVSLGFFLHIPFPHYDMFRVLPRHREILDGLSSLDLVGFHTHDYAQSFLGCIRAMLGHTNTLGEVAFGNRLLQADVFPMGIDTERFESAGQSNIPPQLKGPRKSGRKIVFSVSRLDYTKGIPESLRAIEEFLNRHTAWRGRFEFVLVVVPSRERVERYATLKREIDETVGRINSRFGSLDWSPIRYIYRSLTFEHLAGLYANADVALILPLRDGMNLVAKEYVATRTDDLGVLVLSDMAGASKELVDALTVNPYSAEEVADTLHAALEMSPDERKKRNAAMRQQLRRNDIHYWIRSFLERLDAVRQESAKRAIRPLDEATKKRLLQDYRRSTHRIIVLDYDGTLVPFAERPERALPDEGLKKILRTLVDDTKNTVVILSGRDRFSLESWLGDIALTLVSEHGGWVRHKGESEWTRTIQAGAEPWKKHVRPILELTVERIPASFIEEKEFSLVWHYRRANSQSGIVAAGELLNTLTSYAINLGVQVLPGNRTVEVRSDGVSKGLFYSTHLAPLEASFIFAAGDDWTDEDLFGALPASAYSFKVGMRASKANFNLHAIDDVRSLLTLLGEQ